MEIQQARYFVALCETLNFTRAAQRCDVTQPSLTRAIKLLEDELGGPLFNRERNNTHLTDLGRLVAPPMREMIAQAQSAKSQARAFGQLRRTQLKLGIAHGLPLDPLQSALTRYALRYPDTEIEIRDERAGELQQALRRGDLEVVLLPASPTTIDDLHYHTLAAHRLHLVLPVGHPLALRACVPLRELARHPIVCGAGCQFWEVAERALAEQGLEVRPKVIAGSAEWLHALVAAGVGVGLSPCPGRLPEDLVSRPIEAPPVECAISLATKRGRLYSPPVKAFVDMALRPPAAQLGTRASAA